MDYQALSDAETTAPFEGVDVAKLARGETMNMQHIELEPGTVVEQHSHPNEQISYVLEGDVTFRFGDEKRVVGAEESIAFAGGEQHGAANEENDPAVVIEVFHPPR